MQTHQNTRGYYDRLYEASPALNPAYEIYDALRARYIQELVRSCSGPALIVGCGSRRDFAIIDPGEQVFAFDLSLEALKRKPSSDIQAFAADARAIPLTDNQFNLIICSEVLEHIQDTRATIRELRRIMKPEGTLVVSSPNWHSWFGLARYLGEKIIRHPIHSNNQPYDDWKTPNGYIAELAPEFQTVTLRGVWYLPPLHYGNRGLAPSLTKLIFRIYAPLESILSRRFPGWGHLIILKCAPK